MPETAAPTTDELASADAPKGALEVRSLKVADIQVGDRLRPVDPDWAEALAVDIERRGRLIHAIVVRNVSGGRWWLVAGAHRLAAYRLRGWEEIEAVVLNCSRDEGRLLEISENQVRNALSPLDRSTFMHAHWELQRELAGWEKDQSAQSFAISRRWAKDTADKMSGVSGVTGAVAQKLGLHPRAIERDLQLHRGLKAGVREVIAHHAVAQNASQLRLLARQADQMRIARLLADGRAKTVTEAVAQVSGVHKVTDPQEICFQRILVLWSKLNARKKRLFAAQIADDQLTPSDLRELLAPLLEDSRG